MLVEQSRRSRTGSRGGAALRDLTHSFHQTSNRKLSQGLVGTRNGTSVKSRGAAVASRHISSSRARAYLCCFD